MTTSSPWKLLLAIGLLIVSSGQVVEASFGDQSHIFMACIHHCFFGNCSTDSDLSRFHRTQPWHLQLLGWDCEDECGHQCMWKAVDYFEAFEERVQFRGKWPFVRWFGLQEPASAVFSLLNLLANFYGWSEFNKRISSNNRFHALWKCQAYLAMNAWFWSLAFHSRDIYLTESMDYFGAFSIVLFSLYAIIARVTIERVESLLRFIQVPFACFFLYHVYYMMNVKFDHQYHIGLNIVIGIINSIMWLLWTWANRRRPYVAKCAFVVVSLLILSSLEILDFSPLWYVFDAHSLWHLGTAPLPLVWYRFLIDDCRFESMKVRETPSRRTLARRGLARLKEILKELSVLNYRDDSFLIE
ncbi:post-GPI attachment to proteins factor 3 [Galendromus occidentalis]|uniref:Post-GPI attachment to proteins factor 3 n=1 Tax=Galendromus occidentalis TaxID=34638 RepID=A0AAJ6QZ47_9ACAR|nr:post-GPI attachment to proteins factor 3 [Galendromus occidentalis]